jgi:hypothetical protein
MTPPDIISIIHYAITALLAVVAIYQQWSKNSNEKDKVCQDDVNLLKLNFAVLSERVENEKESLKTVSDKLDKILDKLP